MINRINNFKIWINFNCDVSTTINFLESLKIAISFLLPSNLLGQFEFNWNSNVFKLITKEDLSLILGQSKYHIKEKTRDARKDPSYIISMEFLSSYEENLRENLANLYIPKDIIDILINRTINTYISLHNPPSSHRYKSSNFHPYLNENYFQDIDTIEKAYWLGILWADGWISKKKYMNSNDKFNLIVGLRQSIDNKNIIYDFCKTIGFNIEYLSENIDKKTKKINYSAVFMNDRFAIHLINKGFIVGPQKSLDIELPILKGTPFVSEKELYLGFLLGYYDGDGTKGRTRISSGSYILIRQIKEYFQISNEINDETYLKKDGSIGKIFRLALGRDIMAEMLFNYRNSFKDKREAIGPELSKTYDHIVENIENKVSYEKFKKFVWNLGLSFCFSYSLICQKCMKFNVEQPSEYEWQILSN